MTVKRVITTKAIAAPSGCFLSVWIRIEQHSSLRKLQYKQALAAAVPTACQQCTKHSSALGAPHPRDQTRIPPSRIETITSLAPGSSTFRHPTSSAAPWRKCRIARPGAFSKRKPVRVKKTRQIKNLVLRFDSIEAEKALVRIQNLNANLMAFPSLVPTLTSLRAGGVGICRASQQGWRTTCSPMIGFRVLRASSFDDGAVNVSGDKWL